MSRLEQKGVGYRVFRNDNTILPIIGEPDCWNSDAVKQLKDLASSSSAIILVSPEYHGTMSSTMKLQLDWLSKDELSRKPIGLVSLLGGTSNTSTLNHMRHVCRWLGAICIPEQIAIPEGGLIWRTGKSQTLIYQIDWIHSLTHCWKSPISCLNQLIGGGFSALSLSSLFCLATPEK